MNRLNRVFSVCRLNSRLALTTIQRQPKLNYSELPRVKRPGQGKGPISWKSMKYILATGGAMFGALKYLEMQKDAGKWCDN